MKKRFIGLGLFIFLMVGVCSADNYYGTDVVVVPVVQNSANISLKGGADTTHFVDVGGDGTTSNIWARGGQQIIIRADGGRESHVDIENAYTYASVDLQTSDGNKVYRRLYNGSDATYPYDYRIFNGNANGEIIIQPNNEDTKYLKFITGGYAGIVGVGSDILLDDTVNVSGRLYAKIFDPETVLNYSWVIANLNNRSDSISTYVNYSYSIINLNNRSDSIQTYVNYSSGRILYVNYTGPQTIAVTGDVNASNVIYAPTVRADVFIATASTVNISDRVISSIPHGHSVSVQNLSLTNYTGGIVVKFPMVDGTNGQVLKTDGSGVLTWEDDTTGAGTADQARPEWLITNGVTTSNSSLNSGDVNITGTLRIKNDLIICGSDANCDDFVNISSRSANRVYIYSDDVNVAFAASNGRTSWYNSTLAEIFSIFGDSADAAAANGNAYAKPGADRAVDMGIGTNGFDEVFAYTYIDLNSTDKEKIDELKVRHPGKTAKEIKDLWKGKSTESAEAISAMYPILFYVCEDNSMVVSELGCSGKCNIETGRCGVHATGRIVGAFAGFMNEVVEEQDDELVALKSLLKSEINNFDQKFEQELSKARGV